MKRLVHIMTLLAALLLIPTLVLADSATDESVDGDLSGDRNAPTEIVVSAGQNSVSAESVSGDVEYFTMNVPTGMQLNAVNLAAYNSSDGVAFVGVQEGSVFTEPATGTTVGNLLGWTHFGTASNAIGDNILPNIAAGGGAIGFTPPLAAANYTFWSQQTGPVTTTYTLDFMIAPSVNAAAYAEATDGDLANDGAMPTAITLVAGGNTVAGASADGDRDYFTFAVPAGHQLEAILMDDYQSTDGVAFGAIMAGATFSEPPSGTNTANLLGFGHFGTTANAIGSDVLDGWQEAALTKGDDAPMPLPAGTYSVWLQQLGPNSDYTLNFVVTPVEALAVGLSAAPTAASPVGLLALVFSIAATLAVITRIQYRRSL